MSTEKTTAIVLRIVEFSETSVIATLLTREFGKVTVLAKGARRRKSPFEAALDLLAICRIVFLHKSSGAMDLLTEASLERRFRSAATDLDRLYAGFYVVELLRCLTDDHDPNPAAYDLAEKTIIGIDTGDCLVPALVEFELRILTCMGHQPMFSKCVGCGRQKTENNRVSFGLNEGGVLCHRCRIGKQHIISLSPATWSFLNELNEAIVGEKEAEHGKLRRTRGWPADKRPGVDVRRVLSQYIAHLLGFRPRLQSYIASIK